MTRAAGLLPLALLVGPGAPDAGAAAATEAPGWSAAIGCAPTPPGQPGVVWAPGPMRAIRHDPVRCLLYAVTSGPDSQLVVIDTALKEEVARVELGLPAGDLDVAADGSRLAIAHGDNTTELTVITPPSWSTLTRVTAHDVDAVEVTRSGHLYYYSGASIYDLDLATGFAERRVSAIASPTADLELSPDETTLWVASIGATPGSLRELNIAPDGTMTRGDLTPHLLLSGLGFGGTMALSGDGSLAAYAGLLFDTTDLHLVRGGMAQQIYAVDATGRLGVGDVGVFDAELVRTVTRHGAAAFHGALTPSDDEVWYVDDITDLVHHANVLDYLDPAAIGERVLQPLPMAAYTFGRLVSDPDRPWLYGLDLALGELVVIDRATLTPVRSIVLGTTPTDLALDPDGRYLYAGHTYTWAVARIDLDTLELDAMVPTRQFADQVVALRPDRIAVLGGEESRQMALVDPVADEILDSYTYTFYRGTAAASTDGAQVYVGESEGSSNTLAVLDTSSDELALVRELPFSQRPSYQTLPGIVTVPGTTDVFWASGRWDTNTLTRLFDVPGTIITVTPDRRLAISAAAVHDAATGLLLGALPASSTAQALSPDGQTLYLGLEGEISVVDLTTY